MKRIAVVGAGISGMTAAWEICRLGGDRLQCVLFEASERAGGTILTKKVALPSTGQFVVEMGPDGWVTEKPAARQLAEELGLAEQLVTSHDAQRAVYLLRQGKLEMLPAGMRLMVPGDLDAIRKTHLLSEFGKRGYLTEPDRADALRALARASDADISVADLVRRHFGEEATRAFAAPLLAGVFGGDIEQLSARSVLPQFIAWEKQHGSLINALQSAAASSKSRAPAGIFTALRGGNQSLIDAMHRQLPPHCLRLQQPVRAMAYDGKTWTVRHNGEATCFDAVVLATPPRIIARLLETLDPPLAALHQMPASSGVLVALLFDRPVSVPQGFGFLVEQPQPGMHPALLACTFAHQKYPHCAPPEGALLRVFFGGRSVSTVESCGDSEVSNIAAGELQKIFGQRLSVASATVVQRWPRSLPQYAVGHEQRVEEICARRNAWPGLFLLNNAYRGVGLPDLIAQARQCAAEALA